MERQKVLYASYSFPNRNQNFSTSCNNANYFLCLPSEDRTMGISCNDRNVLHWIAINQEGLLSFGNVASAHEQWIPCFLNFNCHLWLAAIMLDNTGLDVALFLPSFESSLKCYLLYKTFPDPIASRLDLSLFSGMP